MGSPRKRALLHEYTPRRRLQDLRFSLKDFPNFGEIVSTLLVLYYRRSPPDCDGEMGVQTYVFCHLNKYSVADL